jgi:hypothetical protein
MFVVRLGPELVRSGKATLLVGRQADFFVLHPGPSAKVDPHSMIFETSAPQNHEFHSAPPVALSSPVIDGGELLDGFRDIRGRVSFKNRGSVKGSLAVRLTVMVGLTRTLYWKLDMNQLPAEGTAEFEFPPPLVEGGEAARAAGRDVGPLHPSSLRARPERLRGQ